MTTPLPPRPHLEHLAKQAKQLQKDHAARKADAAVRVRSIHPRFAESSSDEIFAAKFARSDAQLVIAREHGFESWARLKRKVEQETQSAIEREDSLIEAALNGKSHAVDDLLASDPALATASLWTSCVLGQSENVARTIQRTSNMATQRGGPRDWPPLLYVCFSRLLGKTTERDRSMVETARSLLAHGADPNAFYRVNDDPNAKQTALYGAAGIANSAAMTRLLLDAGADPNDDAPGLGPESLYHAAEFEDLECLRLLLEAGPDRDKVSYCLSRKLDFDDVEGVRLFLEHGADPNFAVPGQGAGTRLHHAIRRRRDVEIIELLLRYGADISITNSNGQTPYVMAVRLGQRETAEALQRHGALDTEVTDRDRFIGACSVGDHDEVARCLRADPLLLQSLSLHDMQALPDAAMNGNTRAVETMLDAGFDVAANLDQRMTSLHWAAWYGNTELLKLILRHDPPLELQNMYGGTPLGTAVFGSTHCHDTQAGSTAGGSAEDVRHGDYPNVVRQLIDAGADISVLSSPFTGSPEVNAILLERVNAVSNPIEEEMSHDAPEVNEHTRAMGDFFVRRCPVPTEPSPLRDIMANWAAALSDARLQGDSDAAMVIRLQSPPAQRATDEEIFKAAFSEDDARQTIARTFLFEDWAAVETESERVIDPTFESAVDAIVHGRAAELATILSAEGNLVSARSPFGHSSTLLHYVSANGVEIQRQRTPRNIVAIASMLIDAGAEVDALASAYGGGINQTTLCLTVSSGHPHDAGVQPELVAALIDGGAKINGLGDDCMPLATALAFGYLETAQLLVARGARVDNIVLAAGLGRADLLKPLIADNGGLRGEQKYIDPFGSIVEKPQDLLNRGFFTACKLGQREAADLLLRSGANINFAPQRRETALHWAAYRGDMPIIELLVESGADTSIEDEQWNCNPATWAAEGKHADAIQFFKGLGDEEV